jgi:hypothetical protein
MKYFTSMSGTLVGPLMSFPGARSASFAPVHRESAYPRRGGSLHPGKSPGGSPQRLTRSPDANRTGLSVPTSRKRLSPRLAFSSPSRAESMEFVLLSNVRKSSTVSRSPAAALHEYPRSPGADERRPLLLVRLHVEHEVEVHHPRHSRRAPCIPTSSTGDSYPATYP